MEARTPSEIRNHANLLWGIAELLRGDYKQADYGKVILPMIVMRRLDQVMEPTRDAVIERATQLQEAGVENPEPALRHIAGQQFYNRHRLRFHQLLDDPGNIAAHLRSYIDGYSSLARLVIERFNFDPQIDRLNESNLLYKVIGQVCSFDLHPDTVSNHDMGAIFEELIRKFAEISNETAGEHFTPREVVRLMVNLLLSGDENALREEGIIRDVFDCACGTGGMLSETEDHIHRYNRSAVVRLFGQELNPESYAICLADMLVKGQDASHIVFGNSLSADGHTGLKTQYCIANPPFGVDWTKIAEAIEDEHERLGFNGRFGPGLPRKSDGQLLFLLHLISKMRPPGDGGSRIAIVHNGSPLFTGSAGQAESEIRRWIIENDWLEAIVALPEQLFYNTSIGSFVWLVTNRKSPERADKVQLIDAREMWVKMDKSLGDKRRRISDKQIEEITTLHAAFAPDDLVKIVPNQALGYRVVTINRPLRARWQVGAATWDGVEQDKALAKFDAETREEIAAALRGLNGRQWDTATGCMTALKQAISDPLPKATATLLKSLAGRCLQRDPDLDEQRDANGQTIWDTSLRDTENVPLLDDVEDFIEREVRPHIPDAHVADSVGKIGYEIPFTRLFYRAPTPRSSAEIKSELRALEDEVRQLLEEVLV